MYGLVFVISSFRIVPCIWHGRAFDFGFFQVNFRVHLNRAFFFGPTANADRHLASTLFGLIGLHVLAVLWHRFVRHDGVLRRMWPAG